MADHRDRIARALGMQRRAMNHNIQGEALSDPSEESAARLNGHNMFADEEAGLEPEMSDEELMEAITHPGIRRMVERASRQRGEPSSDQEVQDYATRERLSGRSPYVASDRHEVDYSGFASGDMNAPTYTARSRAGMKRYPGTPGTW